MDFAKIRVITITDKEFLYAKNNIFDADRSPWEEIFCPFGFELTE